MVETHNSFFTLLTQVFGFNNVIKEWDVARNSQDDFTRRIYCPRVDYAIGPFSIDMEIDQNQVVISQAYENYRDLINQLQQNSDFKYRCMNLNNIPRCFIVIELENTTSEKHKMGSIINASALGKIGIIIAPNEKVYHNISRLRKYLEFLKGVGKIDYSPNNVLIMKQYCFIQVLSNWLSSSGSTITSLR